MSLSLPDTSLYYLPRDNLDPEKFELIISPSLAWSHIDSEYVFDDRWSSGYQLINMRKRDFNGYTHQQPPQGSHERSKLKRMVYSGEVVMLGSAYFSANGLFYIDGNGDLVCRSPLSFQYGGAQDVIREYKRSVARRDYSNRGGKPRPTVLPAQLTAVTQPTPLSTINSKAAGQLLAAGGIYHGNPEDFKKTAEQLGGDAPAGYDQMSSDQIKGLLIAGVSLAAGLTLGRINIGAGKSAIEAATAEAVTANKPHKALSYVDEPPFNPLGTTGTAQSWLKKSRIKYVQLPTKGKIRFVPNNNYNPSNPLPRGPNDGYIDKFGNEWVKGPSRTIGQTFEWDVQLSLKGKAQLGWASRDGSHLNVSLDGRITHK